MQQLYLLLLLLALTAGCGRPLQLVRVEPAQHLSIDRYFYGNPVLSAAADGITVEANYYDASADYLVFDVQIINDGTEDVLFDPALSMLTTDLGERRSAIDPEVQLLGLDWQQIKDQKASRTMAWVGAGILVATAAYGIARADDVSDVVNAPLTTRDVVAQIGLTVADAMTFAVINSATAPAQALPPEVPDPSNRFFWLDHSFRMTTLRPGERAVGKLVFERMDEARQLHLLVRVGEQQFPFAFDQRTLRPGRDEVATGVR